MQQNPTFASDLSFSGHCDVAKSFTLVTISGPSTEYCVHTWLPQDSYKPDLDWLQTRAESSSHCIVHHLLSGTQEMWSVGIADKGCN